MEIYILHAPISLQISCRSFTEECVPTGFSDQQGVLWAKHVAEGSSFGFGFERVKSVVLAFFWRSPRPSFLVFMFWFGAVALRESLP